MALKDRVKSFIVEHTLTAKDMVVLNSLKSPASGLTTLLASGAFTMGTLSSANDTSGVALASSKTGVVKINADTGGVALTGGNVRAGAFRFLLGTAITSGADISTYGLEGR